jgi:prepilin peptidase CpaA
MFFTFVLVIACAIAAVTDLATRRVPNVLTFGLAGVAIIGGTLQHGLAALPIALIAYSALLALGSVVYGRGWFGGGDIKLLAAGAICAGWPGTATFYLATGLAGGALALFELARARRLTISLSLVATAAAAGNLGRAFTLDPERRRLPYAIAITVGALTLLASETIAPWLQLVRV